MKHLTLLRHAKSSWADEGLQDFDRPLNHRGLRDAPMMAQRLRKLADIPGLVLCSSACRTRQTAQCVLDAHAPAQPTIVYHDDLYLASAGTLLNHIQQTAQAVQHLMIIAHNPGLEMLGRQLHPESPMQLATCALLHFALHNDSFTIYPDTRIDLLQHDFPKNG